MSKFNRNTVRPAANSPIVGETVASGVTYEGGPGFARDVKSELFLLAVTNMVGEDTFYEAGAKRDARYERLVRAATTADPDWTARFLRWLRGDANMRSASLVGAAAFAAERVQRRQPGMTRQVVASVLQRADEPGELLAYWTSRYGRSIPKPVKRGIADAVVRLYDERSLLKYDADTRGFRFGDVLELAHPSPRASWQGALFRYAIDRRHNRPNAIPDELSVLRARAELTALPVDERRAALDPERLRAAGMTWESVAGWLQGPMDAAAWTSLIPTMGYMALLRNLRNFDEAGVPDEAAAQVAARLADPAQVAKSRQLPMRFLSAYRAAPSLRWGKALESALAASLANVPALPGRTLVLVDRSGSMFDRMSARSELTRADAAALFGSALAVRAENPTLVEFGTRSREVRLPRGTSVLRMLERFGDLGGTNTASAVGKHYRKHDRVVIVTDEQVWGGRYGAEPTSVVPPNVPVYTWNLAGYRYGHGPSGVANRHTFGGLSDAAFRMLPLLEASTWPF
ncbi:TROVE domain-containing protein [Cryptosporangium aurantiacum]|uniref:TROVE domain-containing protein n=1 Tax=Cryptosporangium aurantiacum TaxID=134849 RepID=A0A1M7RP07_9ACTN|nr:TROVE domain-containing protein [Cryptosporangium aurantiacum]SHN47994.1 TROVE domain-containing protein [Cryptosporangium aurantiacum]